MYFSFSLFYDISEEVISTEKNSEKKESRAIFRQKGLNNGNEHIISKNSCKDEDVIISKIFFFICLPLFPCFVCNSPVSIESETQCFLF